MHLLFCGNGWLTIVELIRERLPEAWTIALRDFDRPLLEQVAEADVLLPSNGRITAEVLDAAPRLALVQQPAAGYEGIDLEAARARGIPVCNAPGKNSEAVAEAALLLALSLARRVPEARRAFAERTVGEPIGHELFGKTLGIIGMGRSGSHLAQIAEGLDMQVLGVRSSDDGARLEELLSQADVVSIHCPLTEETEGLLDAGALGRMKRGALLVNCARGAIVDREALVAALDSGQLGGVGLDVHRNEPADPEDPLYRRDDVVVLPHVGGSTWESLGRLADAVVDNAIRVHKGEEPLHRVV